MMKVIKVKSENIRGSGVWWRLREWVEGLRVVEDLVEKSVIQCIR